MSADVLTLALHSLFDVVAINSKDSGMAIGTQLTPPWDYPDERKSRLVHATPLLLPSWNRSGMWWKKTTQRKRRTRRLSVSSCSMTFSAILVLGCWGKIDPPWGWWGQRTATWLIAGMCCLPLFEAGIVWLQLGLFFIFIFSFLIMLPLSIGTFCN